MNQKIKKKVNKIYKKKNYKIILNKNKMNRCLIFFSGNGIFFPDTIEEFNKTIEIRDRYEWEQISKDVNAKKVIFMRDIKKNWYQKGISRKINNINKIILLLKKETKKFPEIVLIGSSAGGYLASVVGNYLKKAYVINFAGQVDLIFEGLKLKNKKYQNISRKMKNSTIFYFFSNKNKNDLIHYNLIRKNNNIKFFKFDSNIHGPAVHYLVLKKIINMSLIDLKKLSNKNKSLINPIRFSLSLINPIYLMLFIFFKKIRNYIYE